MKQQKQSTTRTRTSSSFNIGRKHRLVLWIIGVSSALRLMSAVHTNVIMEYYWIYVHERRYRDQMQKVQKWKATVLDSDLPNGASTTNATTYTTTNSSKFELTDEWLESCSTAVLESDPPTYYKGKFSRYNYRLGDTLRSCQAVSRAKQMTNTLIADYAKAACPPETNPSFFPGGNLTVIKSLLDARDHLAAFQRPPPDALVIHLRIGDVLESSNATSSILLKEGGKPGSHFGFLRSVYQYVKEIQWEKPKAVVLVGGAHTHDPCPKSRAYTGCLYRALVLLGFHVTLRTDGYEADEDFYFVSHAQKVILGTGGFSYMLGLMVRHYGGEIVGTNIWDDNWNPDEPWWYAYEHLNYSLPHTLPPKSHNTTSAAEALSKNQTSS